MGCCSSSAVSETELNHAIRASRESVIGFFTDFVVDAETKYFLKAKSHSAESDDYDIRDHKGTLAFKVLTRQWSMRCKKGPFAHASGAIHCCDCCTVLLDAEDHPVLCIGLNRSTTYKNFIIHAGGSLRGPELARVQKDITDRTPRLLLTMTQPQRPPVVFELSERWMDRYIAHFSVSLLCCLIVVDMRISELLEILQPRLGCRLAVMELPSRMAI